MHTAVALASGLIVGTARGITCVLCHLCVVVLWTRSLCLQNDTGGYV